MNKLKAKEMKKLQDSSYTISSEELINSSEAKVIDYKTLDLTKREMDNRLLILLLEKYKINPFSNLTVKDIAKDLGMNQNSANQLFKRKDFPSLNFTKPKQICVLSYYLWKLERRE